MLKEISDRARVSKYDFFFFAITFSSMLHLIKKNLSSDEIFFFIK